MLYNNIQLEFIKYSENHSCETFSFYIHVHIENIHKCIHIGKLCKKSSSQGSLFKTLKAMGVMVDNKDFETTAWWQSGL